MSRRLSSRLLRKRLPNHHKSQPKRRHQRLVARSRRRDRRSSSELLLLRHGLQSRLRVRQQNPFDQRLQRRPLNNV